MQCLSPWGFDFILKNLSIIGDKCHLKHVVSCRNLQAIASKAATIYSLEMNSERDEMRWKLRPDLEMYGLEATLIAHLRGNEAALLKDNSDSASIGSGMLSCDYSDWSNTFWSRVLVISQTPNHIASVWPHVFSVSTGYWGRTLKERLHRTECFTIAMLFLFWSMELTSFVRGEELGGDARYVSLPISSYYQTVPSNILSK